MAVQIGAAPKHRVHDSINLVLAECDKVDAVLIEIAQDHDMPQLAVKQVAVGDDAGGLTTGWAIVSGDPRRPLTESDARHVVAAMERLRTSAPPSLAAE